MTWGGGGDQLGQSAGGDPALDLGPALGLFGAAAVELKLLGALDDRLVSAPAQGHLQGHDGELEHLVEGGAHADADGEGGADAVGGR